MQSAAPGEKQTHAPEHAGDHPAGSSLAEKDLEVLVDIKLHMNQERALAAKKAAIILGHSRRSAASRLSASTHHWWGHTWSTVSSQKTDT